MTDQEIFDKSVSGVLAQGGPSVSNSGYYCMYRGPNGRKCAAGHLIDDEHYSPEFEGAYADEIAFPPLLTGGVAKDQLELIRELQKAHDRAATFGDFITGFKNGATDVAERFNLNTDALK